LGSFCQNEGTYVGYYGLSLPDLRRELWAMLAAHGVMRRPIAQSHARAAAVLVDGKYLVHLILLNILASFCQNRPILNY
jgi:hypothetical protein